MLSKIGVNIIPDVTTEIDNYLNYYCHHRCRRNCQQQQHHHNYLPRRLMTGRCPPCGGSKGVAPITHV
jgi:hypothetical protein